MAIIIEGTECQHSYSKSWQEPRPRKCRKCGELEVITPPRMEKPQLFQAYPVAFLDLKEVTSHKEALGALYEAVRALHKLNGQGEDNRFFQFVNKDDFDTISMYLTECWYSMDKDFQLREKLKKEEKLNKMAVKPLSPDDVQYDIPDFVLNAVNKMIEKKFRGSSFTFKAKELIALGRSTGATGANKDWYKEKWMDFENIYREMGWKVRYEQPSYGDSDFDAYYEFTPNRTKL